MKIKYYLNFLLYFILMLSVPIFSNEIEEYIIQEAKIELTNTSLTPLFSDNKIELSNIEFFKDSSGNYSYVIGLLEQGESCYLGLFTLKKARLDDAYLVKLLYLTTDEPIGPMVFSDGKSKIFSQFLDKLNPANYEVFIEKIENISPILKKQKWHFFNQTETYIFDVLLTDHDNQYLLKNIQFSN